MTINRTTDDVSRDRMLTVREVARVLRKSEWWVRQQATAGAIPAFKIGSSWRFDEAEISQWIEDQRQQPSREKISDEVFASPPKKGRKRASGGSTIDLILAARRGRK